MTCELQWDIAAKRFKGISQRSYAEDSSSLPADENGFYYSIKYGFDGVVTERYYALQPGDMFYGAEAVDPTRIATFKSITRRAEAASDYYISYRSRPFTYLDQHPEISVDQNLLNASTGIRIRYNVTTKTHLVYYIYTVPARCSAFREDTNEARALVASKEMQDWFAAENAKLTAFKKLIGNDSRGLDAAQVAVIIYAPGVYLYLTFWTDKILNEYLQNWPEYTLPSQVFDV
jgi:hypothetical protein